MNNISMLDNESDLQYIWRICSAKDNGTLDMTWPEVAEILNKNLFDDETEYLGESAFRKKYQQAKAFYEEVFSKMESQEYSNELMIQKRELEKAKIQFRDERNAWNKQNYTDARVSQKLDYLEQVLRESNQYDLSPYEVKKIDGDNDILVILSDLHIGQTFQSYWGEYNSDVAARRLGQLLTEILEIQKTHCSSNVFVSIQGDLISGSIHKTIQVTNRENVIDQIKIASDLISEFCYQLAKNFNQVHIANVAGNHSRIDKKEDSLHDERLDDLIGWIIKGKLNNCSNVHFISNDFDNGISVMSIRNKRYIGVHGDFDQYAKSGVANLSMMLGFIPYAVTFGHLHTCAVDEANGVKMIRGGSLAGSGDSYTIEKRLSGKPSQMVCVCDNKGIKAYYPIELN